MTQIAFKDAAAFRIPPHGAEGTGRNTHFTADAQIMIDADAVQFLVAIYGIFRADGHAGGILTLLTAHGNINARVVPLNDVDPG